jgi:hypothetical protein
MEIIKSYSLYLNTREANVGNSNNCTFFLTTCPITLTNANNRFLISTPMIELPYSFSQVNTSNYNLPYTYTDTNGGGHTFTSTTMNIPIGNYNITQLQAQLVTSLVANIQLNLPGSTLTANNFVCTYLAQTGKTTMTMSSSGISYTVTITLQFSKAYVLGIMNGFPQVNQTFGTNIILVSPNKVMVNPITSVYLRSDTLKFQTNTEAVVALYANSDILAKIPVTTLPNSIIYYRNDYKALITNKEITELNLYVSDNLSTNFTLDMQGVNYGIMVQIDEVSIKPNNAYRDKVELAPLEMPHSLLEERDQLLRELINKKEKLEKEILDAKEANQMAAKEEK